MSGQQEGERLKVACCVLMYLGFQTTYGSQCRSPRRSLKHLSQPWILALENHMFVSTTVLSVCLSFHFPSLYSFCSRWVEGSKMYSVHLKWFLPKIYDDHIVRKKNWPGSNWSRTYPKRELYCTLNTHLHTSSLNLRLTKQKYTYVLSPAGAKLSVASRNTAAEFCLLSLANSILWQSGKSRLICC